jgi:putative hemolysin
VNELTLLVLAIALLLLGNGFFSGSEIALISARRARIDAMARAGRKSAVRVKRLQDDFNSFLATVQIGVTLMGTLAGVLGGYLANDHIEPLLARLPLPSWVSPPVLAGALVGGGIVFFELVFGELVPKALALRFSETVALVTAAPLFVMARLSRWLVALLTASTRAVLWILRVDPDDGRQFVSQDEIKHMLREGRAQGVVGQTELDLIDGVFALAATPVNKVMVPRPKITTLDAQTPPADVGKLVVESGFSRIPVYDRAQDNFIGIVYAKDVLRLLERRETVDVRKIAQPVTFVPETKKIGPLLKELQRRRTHIGLVIDEHGVVTGLVTLEDLIEEIVGEIHDEHDWDERAVERQRDGSLVVDGTLSAAALREEHALPIPESDQFETVAGFLLERLGTVPRGGETVDVEGWRLTVVDVEKHRISKVKIEKRAPVAQA